MTLLITGLAVFIAVHLFTAARDLRAGVIARLGEWPYKGLYSLISLAAFFMISRGFGASPDVGLYTPPEWARPVTAVLVLAAFISLAGYRLKGHIKAKLRQPMLVGVAVWAIAHLLANGDQAGVLLFGSFLAYSVIAIVLANGREPAPDFVPNPRHDVIALVAGVVLFLGTVSYLHEGLSPASLI